MPRPSKKQMEEHDYAKRSQKMWVAVCGTFVVIVVLGVFQIRSNIKRLRFPEVSANSQEDWQQARDQWQSLFEQPMVIPEEEPAQLTEEEIKIREAALKQLSEQLKTQSPPLVEFPETVPQKEQKSEPRNSLPISE
ncbi:MAG: hypothetical protein Q8P82_02000 [bacterium]|nr:hypothetical protein [bacterium]